MFHLGLGLILIRLVSPKFAVLLTNYFSQVDFHFCAGLRTGTGKKMMKEPFFSVGPILLENVISFYNSGFMVTYRYHSKFAKYFMKKLFK